MNVVFPPAAGKRLIEPLLQREYVCELLWHPLCERVLGAQRRNVVFPPAAGKRLIEPLLQGEYVCKLL